MEGWRAEFSGKHNKVRYGGAPKLIAEKQTALIKTEEDAAYPKL